MFYGTNFHSLDPKGRVTLPVKYRDGLEEGFMVTIGEDFCLQIWPKAVWEARAAKMDALDAAPRDDRLFERGISYNTEPGELDRQGRLLLKDYHRQYAALERDVAIVGRRRVIEIWDRARFDQELRRANEAIGTRDTRAPASGDQTP